MKIVFYFFIFTNLVFYTWQSKMLASQEAGRGANSAYSAGIKKLQLLSELNAPSQRSEERDPLFKEVNTEQANADTANTDTEDVLALNTSKPVSQVDYVCLELGPFDGSNHAKSISKSLNELGAQTSEKRKRERTLTGYWVFLPNYKSWKVAREQVEKLEKKGLKDMFIMGRGPMKNAISLGLFKNEERAKDRMDKIRKMGLSPQTQLQYTEKQYFWINIDVPKRDANALDAVRQLAGDLTLLELRSRQCDG